MDGKKLEGGKTLKGKEGAAKKVASLIPDGSIIGVGTGSTVNLVIAEMARAELKNIQVVTTSYESLFLLREAGFSVLDSMSVDSIDFGFDGADRINEEGDVIKGRGGALLREKIIAHKCREFIIVAEGNKFSKNLDNFPIPVEVLPEAASLCERRLKEMGAHSVVLREAGGGKYGNVITEYGNLVFDVSFQRVTKDLEFKIKSIPGVIENGLFTDCISRVILGDENGIRELGKAEFKKG